MFAPGPFTAKGGKRPVITPETAEFERYLRTEFEGGGSPQDFRVPGKPGIVATRPAPPKVAPTRPVAVAALEPAPQDVRRTKPTRASSKS